MENGLLRVDVSDDGDVAVARPRDAVAPSSTLFASRMRPTSATCTRRRIREARGRRRRRERVRVAHRGPLRAASCCDRLRGSATARARASVSRVQPSRSCSDAGCAVRAHPRRRRQLPRPTIGCGCASPPALRDATHDRRRGVRSRASVGRWSCPTKRRRWSASCRRRRCIATSRASPRSAGATVFSDGLAEYEALDDGAVAVTLCAPSASCRATIFPSAPATPDGRPTTPLAQSLGPFEAEFALALHGPRHAGAASTRSSASRTTCCSRSPARRCAPTSRAPAIAGGSSSTATGLAFSAAMPARGAGWIVLRCVNRFDEHGAAAAGALGARSREATLARLDETPLERPRRCTGDCGAVHRATARHRHACSCAGASRARSSDRAPRSPASRSRNASPSSVRASTVSDEREPRRDRDPRRDDDQVAPARDHVSPARLRRLDAESEERQAALEQDRVADAERRRDDRGSDARSAARVATSTRQRRRPSASAAVARTAARGRRAPRRARAARRPSTRSRTSTTTTVATPGCQSAAHDQQQHEPRHREQRVGDAP